MNSYLKTALIALAAFAIAMRVPPAKALLLG